MPFERVQTPTCATIPEFNGVIIVTTGEELTCWAKGDRTHPISIALEGFPALSRVEVPELNGMVAATTHERLAIGTKGN